MYMYIYLLAADLQLCGLSSRIFMRIYRSAAIFLLHLHYKTWGMENWYKYDWYFFQINILLRNYFHKAIIWNRKIKTKILQNLHKKVANTFISTARSQHQGSLSFMVLDIYTNTCIQQQIHYVVMSNVAGIHQRWPPTHIFLVQVNFPIGIEKIWIFLSRSIIICIIIW